MKLRTSFRHTALGGLIAAIVLFFNWHTSAQTTFTWQENSALWQTEGEWDPSGGPPVAGDTARLPGDNVTISFNADANAQFVELQSGSLSQTTLNLLGNALTLSGGNPSLRINSNATNPNNRLTITNGTVSLEERFSLQSGAVMGVNSQLIVSGPTTVFNTQWQRSIIGFFGGAEVIVEAGAVWNNQQLGPLGFTGRPDLDVGLNASTGTRDGNGLLRVTGTGSTFNGSTPAATALAGQPRLRVGVEQGAQGAIEVLVGGTFEADVVNFSLQSDTTGTALISGNGSSYTTKRTYLGGGINNSGTFSTGGSATMTIANGGIATTELLHVAARDSTTFGKLALDNGTLSVTGTSGALFEPGAGLEFTLHNQADPAPLTVTEGLTIADSVLGIELAPTFSASEDDVIQLVRYGSLTGTFQGLPEGTAFWVDNTPFTIQYATIIGPDSFITLTVIPEPTSLIFLGIGLAALVSRRRR